MKEFNYNIICSNEDWRNVIEDLKCKYNYSEKNDRLIFYSNINHANQQPSTPLTKCEGSETRFTKLNNENVIESTSAGHPNKRHENN